MLWPDLLVATTQGVKYIVDKKITELNLYGLDDPPKVYGLTWDEKGSLYFGHPFLYQQCQHAVVLKVPLNGPRQGWKWPGTRNNHQILWSEGRLLVATTGINAIDTIGHDENVTRYSWLQIGRDSRHVNTVWIDHEDGSLWSCEHGHGQKSRIVHVTGEGKTEFLELGKEIHSIYREGSKLFYCNSGAGEITCCDIKTGKTLQTVTWKDVGIAKEFTWVRTIAATADRMVFGMSNRAVMREDRMKEDSYLILTDKNMEILDKLLLPKGGNICETRITSEPDYAHNLIPFQGLPEDFNKLYKRPITYKELKLQEVKFPPMGTERPNARILHSSPSPTTPTQLPIASPPSSALGPTGLKKSIFLFGLPSAGKTTVGKTLVEKLKHLGYKAELIDADDYRKTLCSNLGFSKEDRIENNRRLGFMASKFADLGFLPVICAIAPYKEGRKTIVDQNPGMTTVCVTAPREELLNRDPKGNYKKALLPSEDPNYLPHFTGISDPFDTAEEAMILIDTSKISIDKGADLIISLLD